VSRLTEFLGEQSQSGQVPAGIDALVVALQAEFGRAVRGIVLYGSCRRSRDASEGLADFLVVVSGYRAAYPGLLMAGLNRLLPPNVFYLETESGGQRVRCKYALISEDQLARRVKSRLDHYFWARFCQPVLVLAASEGFAHRLAEIRASAAASFARRVAPLIEQPIDAQSFWTRALSLTYRCELRPEPIGNARNLIGHDPDYWNRLTALVAQEHAWLHALEGDHYQGQSSRSFRFWTRISWSLRVIGGKLFNLARLFKAAGTFSNGIDYIVWKVERHSGVRVEPTERMRRHPRLAAWGLAWRMWREGGFR
jgi:hypothetical protein